MIFINISSQDLSVNYLIKILLLLADEEPYMSTKLLNNISFSGLIEYMEIKPLFLPTIALIKTIFYQGIGYFLSNNYKTRIIDNCLNLISLDGNLAMQFETMLQLVKLVNIILISSQISCEDCLVSKGFQYAKALLTRIGYIDKAPLIDFYSSWFYSLSIDYINKNDELMVNYLGFFFSLISDETPENSIISCLKSLIRIIKMYEMNSTNQSKYILEYIFVEMNQKLIYFCRTKNKELFNFASYLRTKILLFRELK